MRNQIQYIVSWIPQCLHATAFLYFISCFAVAKSNFPPCSSAEKRRTHRPQQLRRISDSQRSLAGGTQACIPRVAAKPRSRPHAVAQSAFRSSRCPMNCISELVSWVCSAANRRAADDRLSEEVQSRGCILQQHATPEPTDRKSPAKPCNPGEKAHFCVAYVLQFYPPVPLGFTA